VSIGFIKPLSPFTGRNYFLPSGDTVFKKNSARLLSRCGFFALLVHGSDQAILHAMTTTLTREFGITCAALQISTNQEEASSSNFMGGTGRERMDHVYFFFYHFH